MKPLSKVSHTAHIKEKNAKQEIYKFLRHYKATLHTTSDKTPAELLFNRNYTHGAPYGATGRSTRPRNTPTKCTRLTRIPKRMLSTTAYESMTKSCCFSASPRRSQDMAQSHAKSLRHKVPRSQLHVATKNEKEMPRNSRKFTLLRPQTIEGADIR